MIYSVGCNDEGQLGTGDMEHHTVPQTVELEGEPGPIKQVSAGSNHTAILTGKWCLAFRTTISYKGFFLYITYSSVFCEFSQFYVTF